MVRLLVAGFLLVGTRDEGRSRAMLGSVAMALARNAGIPVLLVDAIDTRVESAISAADAAVGA